MATKTSRFHRFLERIRNGKNDTRTVAVNDGKGGSITQVLVEIDNGYGGMKLVPEGKEIEEQVKVAHRKYRQDKKAQTEAQDKTVEIAANRQKAAQTKNLELIDEESEKSAKGSTRKTLPTNNSKNTQTSISAKETKKILKEIQNERKRFEDVATGKQEYSSERKSDSRKLLNAKVAKLPTPEKRVSETLSDEEKKLATQNLLKKKVSGHRTPLGFFGKEDGGRYAQYSIQSTNGAKNKFMAILTGKKVSETNHSIYGIKDPELEFLLNEYTGKVAFGSSRDIRILGRYLIELDIVLNDLNIKAHKDTLEKSPADATAAEIKQAYNNRFSALVKDLDISDLQRCNSEYNKNGKPKDSKIANIQDKVEDIIDAYKLRIAEITQEKVTKKSPALKAAESSLPKDSILQAALPDSPAQSSSPSVSPGRRHLTSQQKEAIAGIDLTPEQVRELGVLGRARIAAAKAAATSSQNPSSSAGSSQNTSHDVEDFSAPNSSSRSASPDTKERDFAPTRTTRLLRTNTLPEGGKGYKISRTNSARDVVYSQGHSAQSASLRKVNSDNHLLHTFGQASVDASYSRTSSGNTSPAITGGASLSSSYDQAESSSIASARRRSTDSADRPSSELAASRVDQTRPRSVRVKEDDSNKARSGLELAHPVEKGVLNAARRLSRKFCGSSDVHVLRRENQEVLIR